MKEANVEKEAEEKNEDASPTDNGEEQDEEQEDEKEEAKKVEEGDNEEDKTTVEVAKAEANNIRATAEHNVKVMKRLGSMEASQGKILAGVEELKKVVLKDEQKIESMEKKQEEMEKHTRKQKQLMELLIYKIWFNINVRFLAVYKL